MKITAPTKIRWRKTITPDVLGSYSKKKRKRISQILEDETLHIQTSFEKLTEDHLMWFSPMYAETISQKENGVFHDVKETTLDNDKKTYYILTVTENSKPIGGTIFSIRKEAIGIAYRIYPNDWPMHTLAANPSLFSDYIITEYALSLGKEFISHGMDRNLYGVNSAIGLATFKMSVGYEPFIPFKPKYEEVDTANIDDSTLIFHKPDGDDMKIKRATLLDKEDQVSSYKQLLTYLEAADISTTVENV